MVEFVEAHITIEGHKKASQLAYSLLHAELAASIDIAEVTRLVRGESGIEQASAWQLAVKVPEPRLAAIVEHIRKHHTDEAIPILTFPVLGECRD
ncbi:MULTISPECIES: divalent cation tolerance protein CutA [unclassified Nonomuraea]|uniref:divalent cation tolerance protein CutA n=1 Tax=unclassified Nonomuraea TaxID=2593643 RepID=UPI0032D9BD82